MNASVFTKNPKTLAGFAGLLIVIIMTGGYSLYTAADIDGPASDLYNHSLKARLLAEQAQPLAALLAGAGPGLSPHAVIRGQTDTGTRAFRRDVARQKRSMLAASGILTLLNLFMFLLAGSYLYKHLRNTESLREKERRLRMVLEATKTGTWRRDMTADQDARDARLNRLLGLPEKESIQPVDDFFLRVHPDDRAAARKAFRDSIERGSAYEATFRVVRPDGTARWMHDQGTMYTGMRQEHAGMIGALSDIDDLRNLSLALTLSEQRYALARRAAGLASWEWDLRRNRLSLSETIETLAGLDMTQFDGTYKGILRMVHPEDRTRLTGALRRVLAGDDDFAIEYRILLPGGKMHWLDASGALFRDDHGEPTIMTGIIADITGRKQHEAHLENQKDRLKDRVNKRTVERDAVNLQLGREIMWHNQANLRLMATEQRYSAVVRSMAEGVVVFDDNHLIVECNSSAASILQHTASELAGRSLREFLLFFSCETGSPAAESQEPALLSLMRGERVRNLTVMLHGPRWVSINSQPVVPIRGNPAVSLVVTINDISEIKRLTDRIRDNELMLQNLFNGITEPLFLLDENCIIRFGNLAVRSYAAAEPRDVVGRACYEVFRGRDSRCEDCSIVQKSGVATTLTFDRESPSTKGAVEQIAVYPVCVGGRDKPSLIVHIRDVTRLRTLEKRVRRAERLSALGMLISSITHEINNPNNFIYFNIPILRDYLGAILPLAEAQAGGVTAYGMSFPELQNDLYRLIENMQHGSERITRTIATLRQFMLPSDTKNIAPLNLPCLIDRVMTMCRSRLNKSVSTVDFHAADELPVVHTDESVIEHILIILLINAAEAANKDDSRITVAAFGDPDRAGELVIEVRDNGCGISEKDLERIFEPFFTTRAAAGGTGLGLYICRDMLDMIDGSIQIESSEGIGTTVRIGIHDITHDEPAETPG